MRCIIIISFGYPICYIPFSIAAANTAHRLLARVALKVAPVSGTESTGGGGVDDVGPAPLPFPDLVGDTPLPFFGVTGGRTAPELSHGPTTHLLMSSLSTNLPLCFDGVRLIT